MSEAFRLAAIESTDVRAAPVADLCRWSVRVRPAERFALESLFGLELPIDPLHSFHSEQGTALWLGPDEWLVMIPSGRAAAFRAHQTQWRPDAPPCSIVDVTHRNAGIFLSGDSAPWVLNAGCPLDLCERAFPAGTCTRTLFGKAEIVLWRRPLPAFHYHIECWRSYAPYVWKRLGQSAAERRG